MKNTSIETLPMRPSLVFMGTPDFAVPALEALVDLGHDVRAVITQPDRPKGRGRRVAPSPVKAYALERGVEVVQPESVNGEVFLNLLREMAPDLFIVVAFGQILRRELLSIPRFGVLNIHASLLPKYRGPAPIQWAILNDEPETGLTLMQMDQGLDTGPMLARKKTPIIKDETAGHLHDRLSLMAGAFIGESLKRLAGGGLNKREQDPELATYAPKITRGMSRIDWSRPAKEISARIRALDPFPGAVTMLAGKSLKLFSASVAPDNGSRGIQGRVSLSSEGLLVDTGQGRVRIGEVQLAGKKRMSIRDFLRGYPMETGTVLGG